MTDSRSDRDRRGSSAKLPDPAALEGVSSRPFKLVRTTFKRAVSAVHRARVDDPASARLALAFKAAETAGIRLATRALIIALAVVAVWLAVWLPPPRLYFHEATLLGLGILGVVNFKLYQNDGMPGWGAYAIIFLYCALLSFSIFGYDLLFGDVWPPQMMLRNGTVIYFFIIIAIAALSYHPYLVMSAGLASALAWFIGAAAIYAQPSTMTRSEHWADLSATDRLALHLDPHFVDVDVVTQDLVVLLIVSGILAAGVWRSRRMVIRQALAARERANLARYFSPRIVDRLAQSDDPLSIVRAQPVAVLFADIVGFTQLSEHETPARVIGLLREFHERIEAVVFDHEGTLDKYLGDGVMATFGTPEISSADAANALASAKAMLKSMDDWNEEREAAGDAPIRLSIGVHYGEVMLGDIGSERRLEFAVIGDVVNVASRLEALTRQLDTRLVVSNALVQRIREGAGDQADGMLAGLEPAAQQRLKGRDEPVAVWTLS